MISTTVIHADESEVATIMADVIKMLLARRRAKLNAAAALQQQAGTSQIAVRNHTNVGG